MGPKNIIIKGQVIDLIPNDSKKHEKAYRIAGSSNAVTIPSDWQIVLNMKECKVEKALVKVKVPYKKLGALDLVYHEEHILIIAPEDFPFHLFEAKGVEF